MFNWLIAARASSYVALSSFIHVRAGNFYSLVFIFGSKTQPFSCLNMLESLGFPWSSRFTSGVDYNKLPGLGRPLQSCLCTPALVLLRFFLHFSLGRFPFNMGWRIKTCSNYMKPTTWIVKRFISSFKFQFLFCSLFPNFNFLIISKI